MIKQVWRHISWKCFIATCIYFSFLSDNKGHILQWNESQNDWKVSLNYIWLKMIIERYINLFILIMNFGDITSISIRVLQSLHHRIRADNVWLNLECINIWWFDTMFQMVSCSVFYRSWKKSMGVRLSTLKNVYVKVNKVFDPTDQ